MNGALLDLTSGLTPKELEELNAYLEHARKEMFPKMKSSAMSVTLLTGGDPDPKLCLELGAAILYEKPLIFLATEDAVIPDILKRIAHRIIITKEPTSPDAQRQLTEAIEEVLALHFPQRVADE